MSRLDKLLAILNADPGDAFTLYGVAQEYAKIRDYTRAVEFYDRCIAADPAYSYAYYHKARALQSADKPRPALDAATAGLAAARRAGDAKAVGELAALIDELS